MRLQSYMNLTTSSIESHLGTGVKMPFLKWFTGFPDSLEAIYVSENTAVDITFGLATYKCSWALTSSTCSYSYCAHVIVALQLKFTQMFEELRRKSFFMNSIEMHRIMNHNIHNNLLNEILRKSYRPSMGVVCLCISSHIHAVKVNHANWYKNRNENYNIICRLTFVCHQNINRLELSLTFRCSINGKAQWLINIFRTSYYASLVTISNKYTNAMIVSRLTSFKQNWVNRMIIDHVTRNAGQRISKRDNYEFPVSVSNELIYLEVCVTAKFSITKMNINDNLRQPHLLISSVLFGSENRNKLHGF